MKQEVGIVLFADSKWRTAYKQQAYFTCFKFLCVAFQNMKLILIFLCIFSFPVPYLKVMQDYVEVFVMR